MPQLLTRLPLLLRRTALFGVAWVALLMAAGASTERTVREFADEDTIHEVGRLVAEAVPEWHGGDGDDTAGLPTAVATIAPAGTRAVPTVVVAGAHLRAPRAPVGARPAARAPPRHA